MRRGFGMQIVVRQSKIGGQRSRSSASRNSLSTLDVSKPLFKRGVVRPPITLADIGGPASARPLERLERLGKFLGKERRECDRLGKFLGKPQRAFSRFIP